MGMAEATDEAQKFLRILKTQNKVVCSLDSGQFGELRQKYDCAKTSPVSFGKAIKDSKVTRMIRVETNGKTCSQRAICLYGCEHMPPQEIPPPKPKVTQSSKLGFNERVPSSGATRRLVTSARETIANLAGGEEHSASLAVASTGRVNLWNALLGEKFSSVLNNLKGDDKRRVIEALSREGFTRPEINSIGITCGKVAYINRNSRRRVSSPVSEQTSSSDSDTQEVAKTLKRGGGCKKRVKRIREDTP
eukprot:TRINITY_DN25295_c0_g1_i1.p1 TRINITY_DN25295_c0_g1~~TRINITY_DN25295_c0_g1_i1.p1  ORF type:complete len:291 (+),score=23.67 TRINITY_DN25295_c0_g1_i1:131-874(+)